jgi:Trypsin
MIRMGSFSPFFSWLLSEIGRWGKRVCSVFLMCSSISLALEGGRGPSEPMAKTPFDSVGSLSVDGRLFTAVLIGPQHVLTAAHIAAGGDPGKIVFRTGLAGGVAVAAQWVIPHPEFTGQAIGNAPGDPSMHADLAVIKLAQPVPLLRAASLWEGPLLGRIITLVSHGGSTSLVTEGENRVDLIFPGKLGQPATYMFDFDGPDLSSNSFGSATRVNGTLGAGREASLVKGDSGSAAFILVNGQWLLAGINTFQINIGLNRGAGGVVLASYRSWINDALNANPPERARSPATSSSHSQPTPLPNSIPFKP